MKPPRVRCVDFIICAHNEASTVGSVVDAAIGSGMANQVYVVADNCSDDTAGVAASHGARVIHCSAGDKGSAMALGLKSCGTDNVCLLDGDLEGLTPEHVRILCNSYNDGQTVGVRGGAVSNLRSLPPMGFPPIGGERFISRDLLNRVELENSGYKTEMKINAVVSGASQSTHYVWLSNLDQKRGYEKWTFAKALRADMIRWAQVIIAMPKAIIAK